jgi:hypothetical protein
MAAARSAGIRNDGMAADAVQSLMLDHAGNLWIVAGGSVTRFDGTNFVSFLREKDIPITGVRSLAEDSAHHIYAVGFSAVAKFEDGHFVSVVGPSILGGDFPLRARIDRDGVIWILGTHAVIARRPEGSVKRYGAADGLRSFGLDGPVEIDCNGRFWVGTPGGLSRFDGNAFQTRMGFEHGPEHWSVRCIFEDREAISGWGRITDWCVCEMTFSASTAKRKVCPAMNRAPFARTARKGCGWAFSTMASFCFQEGRRPRECREGASSPSGKHGWESFRLPAGTACPG